MSTCNWDDKVLSNRWDLQAYLPDILEIYISVGSSVIISHDTVEAIECEWLKHQFARKVLWHLYLS